VTLSELIEQLQQVQAMPQNAGSDPEVRLYFKSDDFPLTIFQSMDDNKVYLMADED